MTSKLNLLGADLAKETMETTQFLQRKMNNYMSEEERLRS